MNGKSVTKVDNQRFDRDLGKIQSLLSKAKDKGKERVQTKQQSGSNASSTNTRTEGRDQKAEVRPKRKEGPNLSGRNSGGGRVPNSNGNEVRPVDRRSPQLYFVDGKKYTSDHIVRGTRIPDKNQPNVVLPTIKSVAVNEPVSGEMVGVASFAHTHRNRRKWHVVSNGNHTTVEGSEYLVQLAPAAGMLGNGMVQFRQPLNPFFIPSSRLRKIAQTKQRFRIKELEFFYMPGCASSTAGQYGFGVTADPETFFWSTGDNNKRKMELMDSFEIGQVWEPFSVSWKMTDDAWYEVLPGKDPREFYCGELIIMSTITQTTAAVGDIHVNYSIEFEEDTLIGVDFMQAFTTPFTGNMSATVGAPISIATGNITAAVPTNTVFLVIPNTAIEFNATGVTLDLPNQGSTLWLPGILLYAMYDTDPGTWRFYPDVPSNAPIGDNNQIVAASTISSGAVTGTASWYPLYVRNN